DILGIAIVGSHARGTAKPGSDVDVVMIVDDQVHYLETSEWPERFGCTCSIRHEDWGLLQLKRVYYAAGREVEFGITAPAWARTGPIDPGTRQVVLDGIRVVYDRAGLFRSLVNSVTASSIDAHDQ
ncbi:MAG: nucleotidyltransferase domain-containing protein, partial [Terracidiphilus sp.]